MFYSVYKYLNSPHLTVQKHAIFFVVFFNTRYLRKKIFDLGLAEMFQILNIFVMSQCAPKSFPLRVKARGSSDMTGDEPELSSRAL